MNQTELQEVLRLHLLWLKGDPKGIRADLRSADLRSADLRSADLSGADLSGADLSGAYLRSADLSGAYLRSADLSGADLRSANLSGAYLRSADLSGANLSGADLSGAYLSGAYLSGAYLSGAYLPDFQICPEEGSFIAWKALRGVIAKLEVSGKRNSTLVGRKCRTDEAKVLAFYKPGETEPIVDPQEVRSKHDSRFIYKVGETVTPDSYNDTILEECTNGIHFFMTRKEAEAWL